MMKKLIKQLTYLGCGLLALISTFLSFSALSAKALVDSPLAKGTTDAVNEAMTKNGGSKVTFFEYIGDFADKSQIDHKATTIIAAILLFIAILCAGFILCTAIMSLVKRDVGVLENMYVKWVSVAAFVCCLLALLIALIFPDMPRVIAEHKSFYEIKGAIGVGAVLFLIASSIASIFSFVHPLLLKED